MHPHSDRSRRQGTGGLIINGRRRANGRVYRDNPATCWAKDAAVLLGIEEQENPADRTQRMCTSNTLTRSSPPTPGSSSVGVAA